MLVMEGDDAKTSAQDRLHQALLRGRRSGRLVLSNLGLTTVPETLLHVAELALPEGEKWWEMAEKISSLDISHNLLENLPDDMFEAFAELEEPCIRICAQILEMECRISVVEGLKIDISGNKLITLSDLSSLSEARYIAALHNALREIPSSLSACTSLACLLLAHNHLEELPDVFDSLPSIAEIDVSHNRLSHLPASLGRCSGLRRLTLTKNRLQELPASCAGWSNLEILDVSENKLSSLPRGAAAWERLKRNSFSEIPESIIHMQSLSNASFAYNELCGCTIDLTPCKSLRVLDLADNLLEDIDGVCGTQLERLDLRNNNLSLLPPELGHVVSLQALYVDGNPLKSVPRALWDPRRTCDLLDLLRRRVPVHTSIPSCDGLPNHRPIITAQGVLQGSHISGNSDDISAAVHDGNAHKVREFRIASGNFTALPDALLRLRDVEVLDASNNSISLLPDDLPTTLISVNFANNSLKSLSAISKLTHLKFLNLNRCAAGREPENLKYALQSLSAIEELHLRGNAIVSLPIELVNHGALRHLDLGDNQIQGIPTNFTGGHTALEFLSLENNDVRRVPPQIASAPKLSTLILIGNPIRSIRMTILNGPSAKLIAYLRDRIPADTSL